MHLSSPHGYEKHQRNLSLLARSGRFRCGKWVGDELLPDFQKIAEGDEVSRALPL